MKTTKSISTVQMLICFIVGWMQLSSQNLVHWTEKDGLPDNVVLEVLQDRKGYVWLGTLSGLTRFDGKYFENFQQSPLSTNEIVSLYEDSQGRIWIGTDGAGIAVYDYNTSSFSHLLKAQNGLTEDRVFKFHEQPDSSIIVGYRAIGTGRGGISIISKDLNVLEHYHRDIKDYKGFALKVTEICQNPSDDESFYIAGRSLFHWNRSSNYLEEITHEGFISNEISINGLYPISDSTLIVGIVSSGIATYNFRKKKWGKFLYEGPFISMYQDEEKRIWIANEEGTGILNVKNRSIDFKIINHKQQILSESEVSVNRIKNLDGFVWLATNRGLLMWSSIFSQFNNTHILNNNGSKVYYPEFLGELSTNQWLLLDRARGIFLTDSTLSVQDEISLPQNQKPRFAFFDEIQNRIYTATERGIYSTNLHDGKSHQLHPESNYNEFSIDSIRGWSLLVDTSEVLWIGTQSNGLFKVDLKNNLAEQFLHNESNSNSLCHNYYLFCLELDLEGNIWIGTDKGISILNPLNSEFLLSKDLAAVSDYVVHDIHSDIKGDVWISTRNNGLFQYKWDSDSLIQLDYEDGLPYNGVNHSISDNNSLWFTTRKGLCHMDKNGYKITRFDQTKGLLENNLYDARLAKLPTGDILLSYEFSDVVSRFNPGLLSTHHKAPQVLLKQICILSNSEKTCHNINEEKIILAPTDNTFNILFSSVQFAERNSRRFQYRLKGFHDDWINLLNVNEAIFTNIPGGFYEFQLKSFDQDGVESKLKVLSIEIKTIWYRTSWFITLVFIGLVFLLYILYKYRMNLLKKEAKWEKLLIETELSSLRSQMNPHFIFNCLNSIKGYIIENKIEEGTAFIGQFSKLIRLTLIHSRERLISLKSELESLELYIKLEQERLGGRFEYRIVNNLKQSLDQILVPPIIFQPFVENAVWHGLNNRPKDGHLEIILNQKNKLLEVYINDNGSGFNEFASLSNRTKNKRKSLGLDIVRTRINQISSYYGGKAEFNITPLDPDADFIGTSVHIQFAILNEKENIQGSYR